MNINTLQPPPRTLEKDQLRKWFEDIYSKIKDIPSMDKVISVTSDYTASYYNSNTITLLCNGTFTVTLPSASTVGKINKVFNIKNIGSGIITIAGTGSDTVELTSAGSGESISLITNGEANWYAF